MASVIVASGDVELGQHRYRVDVWMDPELAERAIEGIDRDSEWKKFGERVSRERREAELLDYAYLKFTELS